MLEIKNISKTYKTGTLIQKALNNVSLNLRDNEFVAILGPSGSGKTTLLNIIGGLDRYDSGDLIINHVSTKKYKDRDWDSYRNHTIGFVFQSYNLIPHQSVLSNVEMALTISGISKKERRKRAIEALDKVGLKEQIHKKPNQMSGGQMQRVAIARALVNNPDILLADEPTGALDTKTSIQIMDLLKEVANDRLVVMVSHNPELAEEYATRIVKIRDGEILEDSDPYLVVDDKVAVHKNLGKAKMGFFTALSLSFNNLLSKKGRTILTAFAGSIGIIGIALILALSTGFQNYIDDIQEETMSSYPLTIQKETTNVFGALLSARIEGNKDIEEGKAKEQMMISSMMNSVGTNDLTSFKKWLEENEEEFKSDLNHVSYSYSVSPRIFTKDVTGAYVQLNPNTMMSSIYSDGVMSMMSSMSAGSSMGTFTSYDFDKLPEECELLIGDWPKNYDDVLIVLSEKGKISDLLVYSLGLRDNKELKTLISDVMSGNESSIVNDPLSIPYEDLMDVDLKLIDVSDLYKYNEKYDTYENMVDDDDYMADVFKKSETLNITGIAYSTGESNVTGVIYSKDLVGHVIDVARTSPIVEKQLNNKDVDVFSGKRFDEKDDDKEGLDFNDMVSIDEDMLKDAFKVNIDTDELVPDTDKIGEIIKSMIPQLTKQVFSDAADTTLSSYKSVMQDVYDEYFSKVEHKVENEDNEIIGYKMLDDLTLFKAEYGAKNNIENIFNKSFKNYGLSTEMLGENKNLTLMGYRLIATNYLDGLKEAYNLELAVANSVLPDESQIDSFDSVKMKAISDSVIDTIINGNDVLNVPGIKDQETTETMAYMLVNIKLGTDIGTKAGELVEVSLSPLATLADAADSEDGFMSVDTDAFAKAFNFDMDEDEVQRLMTSMITGSSASYSNNLINLGFQDVDDPTSISLYFNDFDSKEHFLTLLDGYNDNINDEDKEIKYTDITGMLISSVQTIVNAVTYALIAFVSISLVVSSIMIAVITLISVMERTKEIGILRAMGASKKNVSSIFNAETFIIGLLSGCLGVGVSWLAIFPINDIIHRATDIETLNAVLYPAPAIILVIISVVLTMVAGFIPSKKAAKQDPVIALRSE